MAEHIGKEIPPKENGNDQDTEKEKRAEEICSNTNKVDLKIDLMDFAKSQVKHVRDEVGEMLQRDLRDYKEELKSRQLHIMLGIFIFFSVAGGVSIVSIVKSFNKQVAKINVRISERLDDEFKTERIQELIANKAEEYTEKKSQEYIGGKVETLIAPFVKKFEAKIVEAEAKTELLGKITQLHQLLDLIRLGGRRKTYELLLLMAASSSDIKDLAGSYLKALHFEFETLKEIPGIINTSLTFKWDGRSVKLEKIPTRQIYSIIGYPNTGMQRRRNLIGCLLLRPKHEVLTEALDVLDNSDAVYSCLAASILVSGLTDKEGGIANFSYWATICEEELKHATNNLEN